MNCYACNRDPAVYDQPEMFIPERWMNGHRGRTDSTAVEAEKIGVPHLTYGAGRRVCPGIDSKYTCKKPLEIIANSFFSGSGEPRSLFDTCASFPFFHMGTCAPR
jgi:hypothetical protein